MEMQVPTGYFLDDHQIWGDPGAGSIMSRTYAADFPDLSASDDSAFDLLESNCRLMLASLRPGERLQLHYYTSNDFNRPLDPYAAQTDIEQPSPPNRWPKGSGSAALPERHRS